MNAIETVTLEVDDTAAAEAFYAAAFDLGEDSWLRVRPAKDASSGFRGFAISLVVAQPGTVDSFAETALAAGATAIKAPEKSLWGYGAVLRDPYGNIWKLATSQKKQTGPVTREVESVNVGIGVARRRRHQAVLHRQGLKVAKSLRAQVRRVRGPRRRGVALALQPQVRGEDLVRRRRRAPDRTASSSAAAPGPSPTRTASSGKRHRGSKPSAASGTARASGPCRAAVTYASAGCSSGNSVGSAC